MAKQKQQRPDDFIDDAGTPAAEAPDPDAEKLALLEEIDRLKAQHAAEMAALTARSEAREEQQTAYFKGLLEKHMPGHDQGAAVRSRYWKVTLEGAPTHVVEAPDRANAWEVYRAEMGVISSQNPYDAQPASREEYRAAQAKRHKLKPEEYKLPDDE